MDRSHQAPIKSPFVQSAEAQLTKTHPKQARQPYQGYVTEEAPANLALPPENMEYMKSWSAPEARAGEESTDLSMTDLQGERKRSGDIMTGGHGN